MRNIYDIMNERQEQMLDNEFFEIQEGYDEVLLLDEAPCVTLEQLVYNNPDKKKLSVLIEEAEAEQVNKTNNVINNNEIDLSLDWLNYI